jgi:hypothetical protein
MFSTPRALSPPRGGRLLLGSALLLASPVMVRAETTVRVPTGDESGVTMNLATPLGVMPSFGFLPVKVSVQNRLNRPASWKLRFSAGQASAPTGISESSLELTVEAGQDRDVWYFFPLTGTAPRFTLGEPPGANPRARPAIDPAAVAAPATADVEAHARQKLGSGSRLSWATRMEPGDRPGELVGIAVATQVISSDQKTPPGRELPLGFEVEDAVHPITGWLERHYSYKEVVPDPAGSSAPPASFWSRMSSSLTAEAAARDALAGSGLLDLPPGATQAVAVTPLENGFSGRQVAWLTTFTQTGSPRVLSLPTGRALPPGIIVNLHPSDWPDQVVRTITFVEPAALVPPTTAGAPAGDAAAEARATLQRYGFLRPRPDVRVTSRFPGPGTFALPPQQEGAVVWFESGPSRQLPKPFFGSLPPGTTVDEFPGEHSGEIIRGYAVAPRPHWEVVTGTGGAAPADLSRFSVVVTGSGVIGAAEVTFPELRAPRPGLALPVGVSSVLTAKLRQTLYNGGQRGLVNLTGFDVGSMPADWRFFSPYHLVFLRGAEYAGLDPARKAALLDWVLQGGQLMIEPVAEYSRNDPPLIAARVPLEQTAHGAGTITQLSFLLDDYLAPMDIDESIPDQPVWVKPAEPVELLPLLRLHEPALTLPSDEALRQPPPSSDIAGVVDAADGKWATAILLGFALLAGPANLLVFAPNGRRHRVFLTVPLLAAVFTVTLVACVVLWEGFGGRGDRAAVVLLVPEQGRAVVYQDQVAGTTLLGRRSFAVPEDAVLANVGLTGVDATGRGTVLERSGDEAGGDWFRNRWASAQHLRRIVPAAGRVRVHQEAGAAPVVESSLPAALEGFVYLQGGNRVWYAPEVPAGRPVTLRRLPVRRWPPIRPAGSSYLATVLAATAPAESGRWMARAGTTPIAPIPTLGAVQWTDHVVFTGLADDR